MKKSGAFSPAPVLPSDEEPRARASGELIDSVRPSQRGRLLTFAAGSGLALVALGTWLYVLQVLMHDTFKDVVEGNTHRVFLKQPRRGDILDINGHKLATSEPVRRVLADPTLIHPHQSEVGRALAAWLSMSQEQIAFALRLVRTNELGVAYTNKFVDFKRKVTTEQWAQITNAMVTVARNLDLPGLKRSERNALQNMARRGIYSEDEYRRVYPCADLAAHVLGYVQEVERVFTNSTTRVATTEMLGIYGIEHWLDEKLKGSRGWRVTETDRRQREVVVRRNQDVDSKPGLDVVLTIDSFIQNILETQLVEAVKKYTPRSACGIVVRPRTGEVLAMASLPDFDPNYPGRTADESALRNRVIADVHEPGSTFKIVVVSGALNDQRATLQDVFFCENGTWLFRGKPLRDHEHYGDLTLEAILTKSSNIGAGKVAVQCLGEQRLYEYVTRFGFGSRSGITLDGEIAGIVRPVERWDGLTVSRIPMGQAIATTQLQMTMAMAAIANEGRLMRPMLIHGLKNANGEMVQRYQAQVVREVISPRAARAMVTALKTVPTRDGTAPKAEMEHYTVAGKTGTAQVAGRGGYQPGKYISSFIGFFPADEPELCISIQLEEPDVTKGYYGGQTAAPYFKNVAEQVANYLKIRPDRDETLATHFVEPVSNTSLDTVLIRPGHVR
jgi:cell division protein FtsI/penicillin-binding protein 2